MAAWTLALPALAATAWLLIGGLVSALAPGLILSLGLHARAWNAARRHRPLDSACRGNPRSAADGEDPTGVGCDQDDAAQLASEAKLLQKEEAAAGIEDDELLGEGAGCAEGIPAFPGLPETPRADVRRRTPGYASLTRHSSMPRERPRLQSHPVPRELDLFLDEPSNLTVVLDLDETLVRSYGQDDVPVHLELCRHLARLEVDCGGGSTVVSFLRPGLLEFLARVSRLANVYVYTAGDADYARPLIQMLDADGRFFLGSLYRDSTVATSVHDHVKDLARLGGDLARTVLVDNNPYSFLLQPDNGLLCESFFGEPGDRHLLEDVLPTLHLLARVPDVRPILRRRYNLAGWCRALEGWCS
ncbi:unnamed protein product [Ostreobium quekettii]|uniref:Mitochondrial import inner membrane translocase subunit TIM50 n=1 Tax=Ostreobium quekettii TaxID=121088 RepID=A0A8S1ISX4_9CHLO|nr:unnamed protein product [Ostreobium quekettii]|eukprot:evm.model.scf_3134.1 EVM.evm.TU.scf_3134.1   scf_3134:630-1706(+)